MSCGIDYLPEIVTPQLSRLIPVVTTYSTPGSGTHTYNTSIVYYTLIVMGAGASGGVNAVSSHFGGGGGSGARFVGHNLVPSGATASYTVGAGGAAVTSSGADISGNNGGASFFDIWAADGGKAGVAGAAPNGGAGGSAFHFAGASNGDAGAGGGSSARDWAWNGSDGPGGGQGTVTTTFSGFVYGSPGRTTAKGGGNAGGDGWDGPGGNRQNVANTAGNDGVGTSSGGSGARRTAGSVSSGKGANGRIIVIEFVLTAV